MARKTVLPDEEEEIEVEEEEREERDGEAVDPEDRDIEDDEEDEGEDDEYEKDGFIVDDVDEDEHDAEEEDRADSDDERQKKKKRKKRESEKNYVLDEDDYELLQDNNITGFRRPKVESKKFKRLKKATADADEGQSGFSDEEKYNRSGNGPPIEEEDGNIGEEEDEMADFIVDEEEVDENGEPRRRRRKVNKKKSTQAPGVSSTAIQEARDIFGDVDELLRQRKLVLERMISTRYDDSGEDEFKESIHQFRKIKSIQKSRYNSKDPYHYENHDNSENEKEKASAMKHFKSRMIVHPRFRNITADEAIEMLSDKEPGESIVRPSSRGLSYLTLTLKVYNGVYAHKHIIESGKENKDTISKLRLGKTLKIGEDVFEDLDEVMDRYVDPLVSHLKTMLGYRKFKDGRKTEVDESLRKEKAENPSSVVYSFGISHEHPGTFILTYIRSTNMRHEYVGLYPTGFKFRNKMFEQIDRLVAYFQRHIDDPDNSGEYSRDQEKTSSRPGRNDYRAGGGCHDTGGGGWWGA